MKVSDAILVKPLVEKLAGQEMDAKVAIEFAEWAKVVLTAVGDFERKRAGLFEKYGEQVEGSQDWKIKEENETKFKSAITRAMNKKLDIEPFDLSNSGIMVTPADVVNIMETVK